MALAYIERVPTDRDAFGRKVEAISSRLGINPDWLMIVMNFETAGKFLPGYYASSGAVGLIQFTSAGASQIGATKDFLSRLTAIQQLDYVEKYFVAWKAGGRMSRLEDVYDVVFQPAFLGKPDSSIVHRSGSKAYTANKALDINKDGVITAGEVRQVIRRFVPSGYVETADAINLGGVALLAGGIFLYKRHRKRNKPKADEN